MVRPTCLFQDQKADVAGAHEGLSFPPSNARREGTRGTADAQQSKVHLPRAIVRKKSASTKRKKGANHPPAPFLSSSPRTEIRKRSHRCSSYLDIFVGPFSEQLHFVSVRHLCFVLCAQTSNAFPCVLPLLCLFSLLSLSLACPSLSFFRLSRTGDKMRFLLEEKEKSPPPPKKKEIRCITLPKIRHVWGQSQS